MTTDEQNELVRLHNEHRSKGWRPRGDLRLDPKLTEAAQLHAEYMAERRRMSHVGRNRSSMAQRVRATGYGYSRVAENVAAGQQNAESVMRAWIRSRGHNNNILGNYIDIGVGRAGNYWCVVFAMPNTIR